MRVGLSTGAKREAMIVPDLRTGPPPRWSVAVDGVIWLPRLAAKARACDAGTLGRYLYGQSPVDDSFLKRAGLDYAGFLAIARTQPDDAGVLEAIEATSPGAAERLRRWSTSIARKQGWFFRVLDADEGHLRPSPLLTAVRAIGNAAFVPVLAILRTLRPAKL
jgi:Domain of unknown function (DUF5069)